MHGSSKTLLSSEPRVSKTTNEVIEVFLPNTVIPEQKVHQVIPHHWQQSTKRAVLLCFRNKRNTILPKFFLLPLSLLLFFSAFTQWPAPLPLIILFLALVSTMTIWLSLVKQLLRHHGQHWPSKFILPPTLRLWILPPFWIILIIITIIISNNNNNIPFLKWWLHWRLIWIWWQWPLPLLLNHVHKWWILPIAVHLALVMKHPLFQCIHKHHQVISQIWCCHRLLRYVFCVCI